MRSGARPCWSRANTFTVGPDWTSPQKSSSAGLPLRTRAVWTGWKIQYCVCGDGGRWKEEVGMSTPHAVCRLHIFSFFPSAGNNGEPVSATSHQVRAGEPEADYGPVSPQPGRWAQECGSTNRAAQSGADSSRLRTDGPNKAGPQ